MLQSMLRETAISLHLETPNREACLTELVALFSGTEISPRHKADLLELLLQRERFGTTAIGEGAALPHCVFSGVSRPVASLGISRRGIAYPSLDGDPVFVVLLMVFPEKDFDAAARTEILREAEALLRDRFVRERLKICETAEEAYEVILRQLAPAAGQSLRVVV